MNTQGLQKTTLANESVSQYAMSSDRDLSDYETNNPMSIDKQMGQIFYSSCL